MQIELSLQFRAHFADKFCRSRPATAPTSATPGATLPEKSRLPAWECFHPWSHARPQLLDDRWLTWWCGWHDGGNANHGNRPQLGRFQLNFLLFCLYIYIYMYNIYINIYYILHSYFDPWQYVCIPKFRIWCEWSIRLIVWHEHVLYEHTLIAFTPSPSIPWEHPPQSGKGHALSVFGIFLRVYPLAT